MSDQQQMHDNGTPWGVAASIAKKDGVIGVLLLGVCYLLYHNGNQARDDRERMNMAYRAVVDSLVASHRREFTLGSQSIEVIRSNTRALEDNTRVLSRLRPTGRRDDG